MGKVVPESLAVRRAGVSDAIARVHEVLEGFASSDNAREILTAIRHFPAREAQWADFPDWVNAVALQWLAHTERSA